MQDSLDWWKQILEEDEDPNMDVKVSPYETVIVETYIEVKPGKRGTIHVRPVSGQPFPTNMDVECSYKVREEYPVGTKFKISARLKNV